MGVFSSWNLQTRALVLVCLLILPFLGTILAQTASDPNVLRTIDSALRSRNFEQALALIQTQLEKTPRDARLWTLEGIAFAGSGKEKEALVAYNKALSISPEFLAALEGAAGLEFKAESDKAIPLLNRILKLRPAEATTHAMLGVMAYKKRDCGAAVAHFRQGRQVLASQPSALEAFGACLMEQNQEDEALPVFEQLLAMRTEDAHARYNLAVVQVTAKRNKEAIETLQPLLAQNASDPDTLDLASAAYEEAGDTPRAVSLLRQAIVASPRTARYYVDFAALSLKHESYQVGVDMINVGIKLLPETASLYIARGILFIQMGNFESGQMDFGAANKLDPGQAAAAVAQGLAQLQQSNLDQALATVEEQLKTHRQDAFLHYLKAEILTQKGAEVNSPEFGAAVAAAGEAVRLKADFVLARDVLGNLYLKSGQNELAIEQSRLSLRDNPSDQVATYHLLQGLRKTKDPRGEIPGLVKKLAALREEAQKSDGVGVRYKLYESGRTDRPQ